jgi:hypothetical protein
VIKNKSNNYSFSFLETIKTKGLVIAFYTLKTKIVDIVSNQSSIVFAIMTINIGMSIVPSEMSQRDEVVLSKLI